MAKAIEIGRLLRAGTAEFVVGCRVGAWEIPTFGALVRAPLTGTYQVYGLIRDIRIEDDGLVRQLVTAEQVTEEVIRDNRERRIVPVEMSVVVVGWEEAGRIRHQLPPRPPLSLDLVYLCDQTDIRRFTSLGQFAYFRHLLRMKDVPLGELLAAHFEQVRATQAQPATWTESAVREVIGLLRDDYPTLTSVLASLGAAMPQLPGDKADRQ